MPNKWKLNTSKVRGRLVEKGLTIEDFALSIGITGTSVRNKLSGRTTFTAKEIADSANVLDTSPLIFFTEDVNDLAKQPINI